MSADPHPAPPAPGDQPLWVIALQLAGLWTAAFVQPLLDLLGKNAAFFVARANSTGDIVIFALAIALLPPLVLTALVAGTRRVRPRLGRMLHLAIVALLVAVFALQLVKGPLPDLSAVLIPLALAIGGLVAFQYQRRAPMRTLLTVFGVAPLITLALFFFASQATDLLFPPDAVSSAGGAVSRTPVVMVIFDELPTTSLMRTLDQVDADRSPNFARMARSSTWYRNNSSVADGTYVAVPAILTGLRPHAQLPTSRTYPRSLFTLLGRTYDQHDEETITRVCPPELCAAPKPPRQRARLVSLAKDLRIVSERVILPSDLTSGLPPIDRDWEDFSAQNGNDGLVASTGQRKVAGSDRVAQRLRDGRAVVRSIEDEGAKPGLWMIHYEMPHVPWRFLPDGRQYVVDGPTIPGLTDQTWGRDSFQLDQSWQRHLLQLEFADKLLGGVLRRLRRSGLWDRALVVVTTDHGNSIRPGGSRRPVTPQNFPDVAGVPLFIKTPGQTRGRVDDTFTRTIDIVPTIAKELKINTPWRFDGIPVDEPHPDVLRQRSGRLAKLVSMPAERFVAARDAQQQALVTRYGTGRKALWRIGPAPQLLGQSLSQYRVPAAGPNVAPIDDSQLFDRVDRRSGVIPTYVTAQLRNVPAARTLAIRVNGRVAATARTYGYAGHVRFSALIPPESLRDGHNLIEVLEIFEGRARLVAHSSAT